ncbi:MAG: hypothetical protein FJ397_07230 [Verrucomicrobia bacterium]|nr:hypothetical protein [Verrucomicrobiota bacterium]
MASSACIGRRASSCVRSQSAAAASRASGRQRRRAWGTPHRWATARDLSAPTRLPPGTKKAGRGERPAGRGNGAYLATPNTSISQ